MSQVRVSTLDKPALCLLSWWSGHNPPPWAPPPKVPFFPPNSVMALKGQIFGFPQNLRGHLSTEGIHTPKFMAALCTRAKRWKQSECPTIEGWINRKRYFHSEIFSLKRKSWYTRGQDAQWTQPETNHQETDTVSSCSREVPESPAHRNQVECWVPGAGEGERGVGV